MKATSCYSIDSKNTKAISGNRIERFYEDTDGRVWMGTYNNGITVYNPEDHSFSAIVPDANNEYSFRVRAFFEDFEDNFYIGTRNGIYRLNKGSQKFEIYAQEDHPFSKISFQSIICSYIDNTGTLWLGTMAGGVNYSDLKRKAFIHYSSSSNNNRFLYSYNVNTITEDSSGNLWIGTINGLNYLNRKNYLFSYYFNDPNNPNSLSYNDIKCLDWDYKGNMLIGTNKGGLNRYNTEKKEISRITLKHRNPKLDPPEKIYGILSDSKNNIWILSNKDIDVEFSSIDIWDENNNELTRLNEKGFFGLFEDHQGNIYIGSIGGVWKHSLIDSTFEFIKNEASIGKVYTVYKDDEILWIGGNKGLTAYNDSSESFWNFSIDNGYPINTVFGILKDKGSDLWLSTNFGLFRTTPSKSLDTLNYIRYKTSDGIQGMRFNYNAYYLCANGEMAFGGTYGFNTFFPDKIRANDIVPQIIISDLKILNQSVKIGERINGKTILNKSIQNTSLIKLSYKDYVFSLEFAAIHFANPEEHQYKYILEGFDKEWTYTNADRRFASYTNLPGGTYTFKVFGTNNDGIWSNYPALLTIKIIPPFWKILFFKIFIVLFSLSLITCYYFYRLRSVRLQKEKLTKLVKIRTLEIAEKSRLLEKRSEELAETNTLLEERQAKIEEQSEELQSQKESLIEQAKILKLTNNEINETNSKLEERQQEIEQQAEELVNQKEQLEKMNKQLEELNATKDKFFSIIAHDLKNPFQTISGFAELLQAKFDNLSLEKKLKYINIIVASAKQTYNLLENLLTWSRSQTNKIKYEPTTFPIGVLINETLLLLKSNFEKKKIKVQTFLNYEKDVYADRNMITTVIRNLLTNAIKYTPNGGEIEIHTDVEKNKVELYIADSGIGMEQEQVQQLFKIEKGASMKGTDGETGTGLGIILCKEFIDKNNGKIWVESEPEKGSKFYITIPCVDAT